jgi:hypothetical protein
MEIGEPIKRWEVIPLSEPQYARVVSIERTSEEPPRWARLTRGLQDKTLSHLRETYRLTP